MLHPSIQYIIENNPDGARKVLVNIFGKIQPRNEKELYMAISDLIEEKGEPAIAYLFSVHPDRSMILNNERFTKRFASLVAEPSSLMVRETVTPVLGGAMEIVPEAVYLENNVSASSSNQNQQSSNLFNEEEEETINIKNPDRPMPIVPVYNTNKGGSPEVNKKSNIDILLVIGSALVVLSFINK